jgi:hypothetical protein
MRQCFDWIDFLDPFIHVLGLCVVIHGLGVVGGHLLAGIAATGRSAWLRLRPPPREEHPLFDARFDRFGHG